MSKIIKNMQIEHLRGTFKDVRDYVLLNIVGLDAITENKVRLGLRKKGIRLQMVKNSLARKVFTEFGFKVESGWSGATTLAWGAASVKELAKEIQAISNQHQKFIKVKTALADGQEVPFETALKMPTRLEAIGAVVGAILGPGGAVASQLSAPGGAIASQIKTISEKKEDAPVAA